LKNKTSTRLMLFLVTAMFWSIQTCECKTIENHAWGIRAYLDGNEISDYCLDLSDQFDTAHIATDIAAGISWSVPALGMGVTVGAVLMHKITSKLLNDLERWESKGKAIVVEIPWTIFGYKIYIQC